MMEDTNFEDILKNHDYELPQVGDIRKGIVVAVTQQGVIIDLGLKRDGMVPASDLAKLDEAERTSIEENQEISVYVTSTDAPDSLQVSIHLAKLNQDWIEAEELKESGDVIEGEVIGYNKGGAIVNYGRIRGFIPASHLTELSRGLNDRQRQQKLAKLRGEKLPIKVIEVDRRRRRLVFSQRDAQKEWEESKKEDLLESLNEGDVLHGRVSGLRDFGIFVDLGGADGLVHISELAWHRIDHPREVVKVGDELDVYVLKIDREEQRISLSRKKLLPNPWDTVEERYAINQLVEGTITRIVEYGAFAEIEPGIEGLLHVSQLSRGQVGSASEVVSENETHLLRVVSIDSERQRIGLSLRQVSASEQIEWMAQKQAEAAEESTDAEDATADVEEAEVELAAAADTDDDDAPEAESVDIEEVVDEAEDDELTAVDTEIALEEAVVEVETSEESEEITEEPEFEKVQAEEIEAEEVAAAVNDEPAEAEDEVAAAVDEEPVEAEEEVAAALDDEPAEAEDSVEEEETEE